MELCLLPAGDLQRLFECVLASRFLRGAALMEQGAFEEAVACLRDALAGGLGAVLLRPYGFARLAEALLPQREHKAALVAVREGLQVQRLARSSSTSR